MKSYCNSLMGSVSCDACGPGSMLQDLCSRIYAPGSMRHKLWVDGLAHIKPVVLLVLANMAGSWRCEMRANDQDIRVCVFF